mgnify:CR=1 FL=1
MLYNVKAGILGLDELGNSYAHLIKDHVKNLNLIAAYGRTQKELLFAKNDLSLEYVYSDEKSLIENHDVDVLFIFSDTARRPHQAIQAINAGKHVFLPNPIALNLDDAQAVKDAADSRPSQTLMASSTVRFTPLLKAVKESVDKGEIGVINHITIDSTFVTGLNKTFGQNSGSVFLDTAIDEIDLCQWLLDDRLTYLNVERNNETFICQAKTDNKSSLNLIVQPKLQKAQSYLNIYGNKGQIIVSNTNTRSYKLYNDGGLKQDVYVEDIYPFNFPEYLQLHHFTKVILGKEKAVVKSQHAVNIIEAAVGFEKSKVLDQDIILT